MACPVRGSNAIGCWMSPPGPGSGHELVVGLKTDWCKLSCGMLVPGTNLDLVFFNEFSKKCQKILFYEFTVEFPAIPCLVITAPDPTGGC